MFYTYVLKSTHKHWFYIGSTKDLRQRFVQHNAGSVTSTQYYKPFKLVYYEAYERYALARKREIELKKHGQQKEIVLRRLGYMK